MIRHLTLGKELNISHRKTVVAKRLNICYTNMAEKMYQMYIYSTLEFILLCTFISKT